MSEDILVIRIGRNTLSWSKGEEDGILVVRSGISMAANLREAFRTQPLLAEGSRCVRVEIDAPTMLVPAEQYSEESVAELYAYTFPKMVFHTVLSQPMEELGVVAVFGVNKDLKLVIDDRFEEVTFVCSLVPVWRQMHRHSVSGIRNRLYAYFHEKCLDVFCFNKNRFKFCNQFESANVHDALYFLLYVWKQLMLKPEYDELFIMGAPFSASAGGMDGTEGQQWLLDELKRYIGRVQLIENQE